MTAAGKNAQLYFSGAVLIGLGIWLILFVLQAIGLYTMAKRANMKKKFLAFIPFANIYYMGKLAGNCAVFGHKMKNAGLYAMIAQILSTVATLALVFSEWYLFFTHGWPLSNEVNIFGMPHWEGLTGFSQFVYGVYEYGSAFVSIIGLVSKIMLIILMIGLLQKYVPKNYRLLAVLSFMFAPARFIIVFAVRNRQPINFEEYMRRQHEAYIRRQQQYYGNYGNPYGNPYGRPPYNGNPYGGNNGQTQNNTPPEDPFEEFSSTGASNSGEKDEDDFFN